MTESFGAFTRTDRQARFSDWLRARAAPAWTQAVGHRFTRELAADTLPDAVYARYLVQDYVFIDTLARLLGHGVASAPEMAAMSRLAGFLAALTSEENDYFLRAFAALGVAEATWSAAEPDPVIARFGEVMLGAAREGYPEILAVLLPAEWIYLSWAMTHKDAAPERFYLAEWIALHTLPEFEAFVNWLRDEIDRHGPKLPPERQERLAELFTEIAELEVAFFDKAYGEA
ncbi:MAG: TenA family protein [Proteobacteria bacterium]|nr:TenA family protein [Pseudomonadota bacterium]